MEEAPAPAAGPQQQQQQQQQQQEQQAPSPFLRCLAHLNDDVLATYLLPKLVEQGCAGALVLTCSWLRALCQPSIQHLDLSKPQLQDADNPCHSPGVATQLVDTFPQCTSLAFVWSSSMVNSYRGISMLLPGLPNLSTISITHTHSSCADLHLVLGQLHTHASALRCLSLQLSTGLGYCNATQWAALGKLVTLTRLQLSFNTDVPEPCTHLDLRHLSGLSRLQSLLIEAPDADVVDYADDEAAALRLAVQQFPGRLTALTELELPSEVLHGISSIRACVDLRSLRLESIGHCEPRLDSEDWAALAQLTRLTRLHVHVEHDDPDQVEALYGALKQLKGLRSVGSYSWGLSSLPVLQGLTHVTAVHGGWEVSGDEDFRGLVCPHIKELGGVWRVAPWQAFPHVVDVSFYWMRADSLQSLSRHCSGVQSLALVTKAPEINMWDTSSATARHSALRSLAHLRHLTHLELAPGDDGDLVAFTSAAAAAVGSLQLRYLYVSGPLSLFALMPLLTVRGLRELSVQLAKSHSSFTEEGVRAWLVALAMVPKVSLVLCSEEQQRTVKAAQQWAVRCALPLPAVLKVSVERP